MLFTIGTYTCRTNQVAYLNWGRYHVAFSLHKSIKLNIYVHKGLIFMFLEIFKRSRTLFAGSVQQESTLTWFTIFTNLTGEIDSITPPTHICKKNCLLSNVVICSKTTTITIEFYNNA